jgi:hypothetical protein
MTLLSSINSSLGVGTIIDAAGPPDPKWLICDGSVLEQSNYSRYVSKISDIHPQCWSSVEVVTPPAIALSRTGIAKKGSTIVVLPYNDNDVFYSTDSGSNWQTASNVLPSTGLWSRITANGTYFVALRDSSNAGAYSSDGINWTGFTMPATASWEYLLWNGTVFIAGPQTSNAAIYYSSDGYNWSTGATFGTGVYPNTIPKNCDASGYFIFYDSNNKIRKTNNGSSLSTATDPFFLTGDTVELGMFYYFYDAWWGMDENSAPTWWSSTDGGDTWQSRPMDNNDVYDDYFYPYYGSFDSGEEIVFLDWSSGVNWITRDMRTFSPRINLLKYPSDSVFISKSVGAFVLTYNGLTAGDINCVRVMKLKYTNYDYTTHFQLPMLRGLYPGMYKYIKVK